MAVLALLVLPAAAHGAETRYSLANGCYALQSQSTGKLVVKDALGGYAATAATPGEAEAFRMQATALGHYLLFGRASDFMAASLLGDVQVQPNPSDSANWQVDDAGPGTFRISLPSAGKALAVGPAGKLVLSSSGGDQFSFQPAEGCATFPESDVNAVGGPSTGQHPFDEVRGLLDGHMHMMAFEFLGGRAHCGRPWSPFGAPNALVDCPDHYPNGAGAVLENALYGDPAHTHDPVGWPTFKDWPHPKSLTHENSYWKWLERSWRGGLRVYVNLFVENGVLCELYPLKQNSCNEMDSIRKQAKDIRELQDYIDAQYGGPGKGWFRIVTDPFEARRVINQGKLAVVLGIEVSEPFGCRVRGDTPQCDAADIDRGLDEVYKLGVRDMEMVNKFDNALAGVAGDNGTTGAIVNEGNKYATGEYWRMQTCKGPEGANDREQPTPFTHNTDALAANAITAALPPGATPVYPPAPHCNTRGLTTLGEHMVRKMMEKQMIVDPDHLDVLARNHVLSLLEAARYSGVISSHSWSSADAYPRIYRLGGVVTPYGGNSETFVKAWQKLKPERDPRFYWGIGYGADMNGFGSQGLPRIGAPNPVRYPFKSFDGKVTLDRQHSGQRVFDINKDGTANYGMWPDWIEDLRMIAGNQIVKDMARGPEAYLQMWERANGVPMNRCQPARLRFTRSRLGHLRLGASWPDLLRSAGQPASRPKRVWRWCANAKTNKKPRRAKVLAVLTPAGKVGMIASTGPQHRRNRIGRGASARRLHASKRRGIVRRGRFAYGIRKGRVAYVALVGKGVSAKRYLKLAGLR
jgi:microsomal dipeptidase-like Zn-dependent dipeptidase